MSSPETSARQLEIALVGLLQGLVLYGLYRVYEANLWPASFSPIFNALVSGGLFFPLSFFWTERIMDRASRLRICAVVTVSAVLLGGYHGFTAFPDPDGRRIALGTAPAFLGCAVSMFIFIPLMSGRARGDEVSARTLRFWNYGRLFDDSWRNAVLSIQAVILTCVFWAILEIGAQLFHLIGVTWIRDELLHKSWFVIPATTTSFALAFRAGLRRAEFAVTLRNHWLAITAWLLVIVSVIGTAFILTAAGGVADLFGRGLSAFFLLWFVAFWVTFFNSAFQTGELGAVPFGARLRRLLSWAAVPMLVMAALAAYALMVRIQHHGLTPDRVWGILVALIALIYGVGYSAVLLRRVGPGWMTSIPATNVFAAIAICVGILLLLSPMLDPRRIAVANQLARVADGTLAPDKFDMGMLTDAGRFGYDQLIREVAMRGTDGYPTGSAMRAQNALRQTRYRYAVRDEAVKLVSNPLEQIDVYPTGAKLPNGLDETIANEIEKWEPWRKRESCFAAGVPSRCTVLMADLNADSNPEAILWHGTDLRHGHTEIFAATGGKWKRIGQMEVLRYGHDGEVLENLRRGEVSTLPSAWRELRIGSQVMVVDPDEPASKDCGDRQTKSAGAPATTC